MSVGQRRFVLLGRDGVINRRSPSALASCWDKFEFLPRALDALRLLAANNFVAIVVSREVCAGNGKQSPRDLDAFMRRFLLEVALSEGNIAQVYSCRHREGDDCLCFKPGGGLVARAMAEYGFAAADTYFIGDEGCELKAAAAAGCPCIRIRRDAFLQPANLDDWPNRVASSLYEAAQRILAAEQVRSYVAVRPQVRPTAAGTFALATIGKNPSSLH